MKIKAFKLAAASATLAVLAVPAVVLAATTPTLNQSITAGTLSANILQSDDATPVASPSVNFGSLGRAFTCQTATGTLGDTNDLLNVTNMAANNGWTLALAATGGDSATWTSGSNTYNYNNATGSGCTNGQMTVNPSVATITTDCSSVCNAVTVNKGASTTYVSGTTSSVTLMSTSSGTGWAGYITGVSLSQKVPANQPSGSYSLPMTLTITAQ